MTDEHEHEHDRQLFWAAGWVSSTCPPILADDGVAKVEVTFAAADGSVFAETTDYGLRDLYQAEAVRWGKEMTAKNCQ